MQTNYLLNMSLLSLKDNLSYVRLRHLVSKKPHLLKEATVSVLNIIQKEISHSQDYNDREMLLPMLHLFRELLTMVRHWITAMLVKYPHH